MDKQTAIDLLDNLLGMVEDNHDSDYDTAIKMGIDALQSNAPNALSVLDCVERQAAIDRIERHIRTGDELYPLTDTDKIMNYAFEVAASCVYNLPSAQPEIIRCKDCKYCDSYIAEITSDGNMERIEYRCKDFHASVMPDEYCSRGERRDG